MAHPTKTAFIKSEPQIQLESILHDLREKELTVSQLKALPKYAELNRKLNDALAAVIDVLVHEKPMHDLILSIARAYPSQYYSDRREYDTLYEVMSAAYIGLFHSIQKSAGAVSNIGRVRIDTYLDKDPELFVLALREYIRNNIVLDTARRHGIDAKHIEPDTAIREDAGSFCKSDSVNYNRHFIEDSIDHTEAILRRLSYKPDVCSSLIHAVIQRFLAKKPVAGYVYLLIMNESYDPVTVTADLKTKDFDQLFHALLHELECNYHVDLSCYDSTVFRADKYLASFRSADDAAARARIDRLASRTRSDVQKLRAFIEARSEYVDVNEKYFCL